MIEALNLSRADLRSCRNDWNERTDVSFGIVSEIGIKNTSEKA